MKKNPLLIVLLLLVITVKGFSQDFNLFNPSNELYLFSAYDEGANAFRYNPAVLGLNHRLNAALNVFSRTSNCINLNDLDIMINAGSFGFSYRKYYENVAFTTSKDSTGKTGFIIDNDYNISTFSMGFGIGNKTISAGILGEWLLKQYHGGGNDFSGTFPTFKFGFGILYRPYDFLSTSFVYKNDESFTVTRPTTDRFTIGTAIRPLRNDRLTLMADFSTTRYGNVFFDYNMIKAGAELKLINGLYINANYTRIKEDIKNEFLNFGIRFDLPHGSVRFNQTLNNTSYEKVPSGYYYPIYNYISGSPFKSLGSSISISYHSERKESIVPEKKQIVEITLSGSLQDYHTDDVFFGILGKGKRSVHEVISDIDYAAADPSVRGIILKIYPLSTGRFEVNAAIEELTASMERFKSKGKKITAYFPQDVGPGEYYVATYANDIVIPPEAFFFYGLSIEVINYKQFLEKYGVELQNIHAGKYKLTFQGIVDSTTEEGKEVINRILDIVYDKMLKRVSEGRKINIDDYMRTKLSQPLTAAEAERLGLVDKLGWYNDAVEISENSSNTENIVKSFNRNEWDNGWSEPDAIAIVGVYGTITTGESEPPPPINLPIPIPYVGSRSTGSETTVRQLEDAFANPKVKAVILRIDSGGGSVIGSAEINAAVIRLKKKYHKPLIVSMGGSAASGGYYIAANADKIFADDLTVTGSIGVFTVRPNLDSLINQQKIKVEIFKRGENSDIGSWYKKLDEKEIEIIQGIINYYYDNFVTAVSTGRKISKEEAEQVAQGRVWLGTDAFNKKLVDEIGGLSAAINYGRKTTGVDKRYKLIYYAVPNGSTINDLVTTSVVQYLQSNLLKLTGFNDDDDMLEIEK